MTKNNGYHSVCDVMCCYKRECSYIDGKRQHKPSGALLKRGDPLLLLPTSLHVVTQDLDNTAKGEPSRNVFSSTEHLTELGTRKLVDFQALFLGVFGRDVFTVLGAHQVERRNGGDTQSFRTGLGQVLGVIGTCFTKRDKIW